MLIICIEAYVVRISAHWHYSVRTNTGCIKINNTNINVIEAAVVLREGVRNLSHAKIEFDPVFESNGHFDICFYIILCKLFRASMTQFLKNIVQY